MDTIPMATLLARRATLDLAHSARPDAPVVPDRVTRRRERTGLVGADVVRADVVRMARARAALASVLRRAADAVAPPRAGAGPHATAH